MITSFFKPKASLKPITKRRSLDTSETNDAKDTPDCSSESASVIASTNQSRKRSKISNDETSLSLPSSCSSPSSVEELLSSLDEPGWRKELASSVFSTPTFVRLAEFVSSERRSNTIYPPPHDTWAALNLCPLDQIKVVIVGQDPYHGPNQAHGLCFSVLPGQAVPPSLRNIYQELKDDANVEFHDTTPTHGHLIRWAQQGVLLLNHVLTVRRGQPFSHQKKGWEDVTHAILKALKGRKCVFLAWGKPASHRIEALGRHPHHVVISTSHPSPLGARKTTSPFMGSFCFSRCNQSLQEMGMDPIDWRVDGPLPSSSAGES